MSEQTTQGRTAGEGGGAETLAEQAFRLLEDAIVRLDLPPGARVTEQELAARIGMGRTPVREAVQRLVSDGLLVVYPRKGMTVGAINPLEVLMALDVRAPVERVVAMAAARRARPDQRTALSRLGEAMREAATAGDIALFMRCDHAFDDIIAQCPANPYARRALAPLQTIVRRAWYYFRSQPDLAAAAACHAALAAAVASGDADEAGAASDTLMAHLRNGLKQALAEL